MNNYSNSFFGTFYKSAVLFLVPLFLKNPLFVFGTAFFEKPMVVFGFAFFEKVKLYIFYIVACF
jgi:hypothetical protein